MAKRQNKKDLFGKANYNEELVRSIKIIVIVVLVLGIVYLATALATGEIKLGGNKNADDTTEAVIQYEEIIAGQVLNRSNDEYYVLLTNFTDEYASSIISVKDNYESLDKSLTIYLVDLDKGFNASLIAADGESYINKPKKISDLKVKSGMTLLKVKDSKVTSRVEDYETIKTYLNNLITE